VAKRVVILGAGAAGREVGYALTRELEVDVVGYTDPNPDTWKSEIWGKKVLGPDELITRLKTAGQLYAVVAVGDPWIRSRLREQLESLDVDLINVVHPSLLTTSEFTMGKGVVVAPGVILSEAPVIEDNVWLGHGVLVGHDTCIGRDSHVSGRAALAGQITVGERVMLGLGCIVAPRLTVGDDAVLGSGANVVHDVPPGAVVVGNPAKVIRYRDGY